ncbi:MAG: hypothetical protein ACNA7V_02585 [Bacteroidales bacterium]
MRYSALWPVVFSILFFVIFACKKQETYPVIPEIAFEEFVLLYNPATGIIERGVLKISFKDGDGDIGLKPNETEPPYDYNLFLKYFEIQLGDTNHVVIIDPISGDTANFNARIPVLTPDGSAKAIKGTIEDTIFVYNPLSAFDTIMFEVYLVDRALNKSNVIKTPLIKRK